MSTPTQPLAARQAALRAAISRQGGVAEVPATWAAAHRETFDFVDVRQPHELIGPLGAAEGVTNVPLDSFLSDLPSRDPAQPLVLICRSGRRSGLAVAACEAAGFTAVASVEGGTLDWNRSVLGQHDIHLSERTFAAATLKEARYTTNGLPEVSPDWVKRHVGIVRFVDVREPDELTGPLGQIRQAVNVPLAGLAAAAQAWPREDPIVITCKAGGRAARGLMTLQGMGFSNLASMEGGMLGWHAAGLPTA